VQRGTLDGARGFDGASHHRRVQGAVTGVQALAGLPSVPGAARCGRPLRGPGSAWPG
jgi:hypothetical protein